MILQYNNQSYLFNEKDTIYELTSNRRLKNLSLEGWKELFVLKNGTVYTSYLLHVLKDKIETYDKTTEVNSFFYNGNTYWFNKSERVGLMNLANCSGKTMSLVLGDEVVELSIDKVKNFLSELELYAAKCFVNTSKHLNAIKSLETVEDIINYDYTSGYPEKVTLENE